MTEIQMNEALLAALVVGLCLIPYAVFRWWIGMRFVADGFRCSGSYPKKKQRYKERWSLLRRALLIPLFSAESRPRYRVLGGLSHAQLLLTALTLCAFFLCEYRGCGAFRWQSGFYGIGALCAAQLALLCAK